MDFELQDFMIFVIKANTFTLLRTKYGKTIAGYTPVEWEGFKDGIYKPDISKKSFLLSLDLREKMPLKD